MECNICRESDCLNTVKCIECVCVCCIECITSWLNIKNTCPYCKKEEMFPDIFIDDLTILSNTTVFIDAIVNDTDETEIETRDVRRRNLINRIRNRISGYIRH